MKREYAFALLRAWCDRLISLQILELDDPSLRGGILCPACARVHGRCGDAILPMMYLYDATREERYRACAERLFDWSENLACADGSYRNDTNSAWRGITVFSALQLAEALHDYGHHLDGGTRGRWEARLRGAADYLMADPFGAGGHGANINYPITCAAALAAAYEALGDERYARRARECAHAALEWFTPEGLIYGEGTPNDAISPKGCRAVDLGYNVEESLGALALYAALSGDEEVYEATERSALAHLSFLLPDGAWDNSWGSRSHKWTYWGSRTSDGCQVAFSLLAARNPLFEEAAFRNVQLYAACTHDGLLHGGPHYASAGEPPCVHHTFCHAKALASLLATLPARESTRLLLPSEALEGTGFVRYPSIDTALIHAGAYRATVTGYDYDAVDGGHPTGGSLSLLWHGRTGPICAGSMTDYQLVEVNNMQIPRVGDAQTLTPRIEWTHAGERFTSCNDRSAELYIEAKEGAVEAIATGRLRGRGQEAAAAFEMRYAFAPDEVALEASLEATGGWFHLPILAPSGAPVTIAPRELRARVGRACVVVSSEGDIDVPGGAGARIFNPVGGFEAIPLRVALPRGGRVRLTLRVEAPEDEAPGDEAPEDVAPEGEALVNEALEGEAMEEDAYDDREV